jgi:hypothetical protein
MKWTKFGMVLDVGHANTWDCKGVGSPHCIRYVRLTLLSLSRVHVRGDIPNNHLLFLTLFY